MRTSRTLHLCILLGLGALAGCEDSTSPNPPLGLDAEAALADYEALDSAFASPAWEGFRALGDRTPFGGGAAVQAVAALEASAGPDGGRAFALELVRRLRASAPAGAPAAAPLISDDFRGVTFVYDAELDEYVADPEREGAPANGLRFVVYDVDEDGVPLPDQEIGYADLLDEGDESAEDAALRVVVVVDEVTRIDYATTVEIGFGTASLTVRGFVDGERAPRLDFDIAVDATEEPGEATLDATFELAVEARDFSITGEVRGVEEGSEGEGDIVVAVRHGSRTLDVDISGSAGQVDGTIHLDGELFATISGPASDPVFLPADGEPLDTGELLVLRHLADAAEDVFDLLEDLVDPVDELILLGIFL
ncbi:MAG TPA: hypothetical protein VFQ22_05980 [Longimicrobiales bacterium]|nr:hypothetical protein [Longimicrobiales bacterium]